jgi:hypothetical protein
MATRHATLRHGTKMRNVFRSQLPLALRNDGSADIVNAREYSISDRKEEDKSKSNEYETNIGQNINQYQ